MPGSRLAQVASGKMAAHVQYYPVEASQTIYAGDWVVLVKEASNYNTPRLKKVTQTEITANFTETAAKGVIGVAMYDIVTSSDGTVTQLTPSTVDSGSRATYALPSVGSGLQKATLTEGSEVEDKGKTMLGVYIADDNTEFWIRGATNSGSDASPTLANATINQSYVGAASGIQISGVDFYADLTENAPASDPGAIFVVSGVNTADPNYNQASTVCWIKVRVIPAMQQFNNGTLWTN
jgi:hypothetical protein